MPCIDPLALVHLLVWLPAVNFSPSSHGPGLLNGEGGRGEPPLPLHALITGQVRWMIAI